MSSQDKIHTKKIPKIKILIMDVDGVMTDGRIFLDSNGNWCRFFNVRDGVGILRLAKAHYKLGVITAALAKDVRTRMKMLGIHYFYEGAEDKLSCLKDLSSKSQIDFNSMAYIGDDLPDIPVLNEVGFSVTVPDAVDEVQSCVHYITRNTGGNGAIREICDFLLKHNTSIEE